MNQEKEASHKLRICKYCNIGEPTQVYSYFGLFLAVFLFPIGILCCFGLRSFKCSNCGRRCL
jgi:hypothetical protein